jgi:hypothetical protein
MLDQVNVPSKTSLPVAPEASCVKSSGSRRCSTAHLRTDAQTGERRGSGSAPGTGTAPACGCGKTRSLLRGGIMRLELPVGGKATKKAGVPKTKRNRNNYFESENRIPQQPELATHENRRRMEGTAQGLSSVPKRLPARRPGSSRRPAGGLHCKEEFIGRLPGHVDRERTITNHEGRSAKNERIASAIRWLARPSPYGL